MQPENTHPHPRRIAGLDVPTPLLVPSFSSSGFPDLMGLHEYMKHRLYGVCLISAWDLAHELLSMDAVTETNVVVLDSGGYESARALSVGNMNGRGMDGEIWDSQSYHAILSNISSYENLVTVSFDRREDIERQIAGAEEDAKHAPGHALDFLVKPTGANALVNIASLANHTSALEQFQVIGVTARELGYSLRDRCRGIVMLRDLLHNDGLEIPIHVFGAIKPAEVVAYFLCGADIFDGLSWLRVGYTESGLNTMDEVMMEDDNWIEDEKELQMKQGTRNLHYLYGLQQTMRAFCDGGDLEQLLDHFPLARKAARVAVLSGAQFKDEELIDGR